MTTCFRILLSTSHANNQGAWRVWNISPFGSIGLCPLIIRLIVFLLPFAISGDFSSVCWVMLFFCVVFTPSRGERPLNRSQGVRFKREREKGR